LGLGVLGALAFASENAHQSWSAVFATDALGASAGTGAMAPAVFAATVAITRFLAGGVGVANAGLVLAAGSAVAAVGAVTMAAAPDLVLAALGLVLAAAGTAVLFPMILVLMSSSVDESRRGTATSTVTAVAYLGFLLGPVYVGLWSGVTGIRGAMLAVGGLGVLLLLLAPVIRRGHDRRPDAVVRRLTTR
jgi:MFS family permease